MADKTKKADKKEKSGKTKKVASKSKELAPAVHENRVSVIGCGNVGMASAFALLQSELIRQA